MDTVKGQEVQFEYLQDKSKGARYVVIVLKTGERIDVPFCDLHHFMAEWTRDVLRRSLERKDQWSLIPG